MRNIVSTVVIVALAVSVVSFFAAPWVAFRALRAAAAAGDVAGIGAVADITAVRQSLRAQLSATVPTPAPKLLEDPLGALGHALRQPITLPPDVDAYLTPAAMAELANANADAVKRPETSPFMPGDLLPGLHQSEVRFWDLKRTQIAVASPRDPARQTLFTFERRGFFTWRLVHIRLPAAPAVPSAK